MMNDGGGVVHSQLGYPDQNPINANVYLIGGDI